MLSTPLLLLLVTVLVRLVPAMFVTGTEDVGLFHAIATSVVRGHNPYSEVAIPWPPLWAAMVAASKRAADFSGLHFAFTMKLWTIAADALIALALFSSVREDDRERDGFRLALLWALNPVSIFFTAMHGQFDSIPAACVLLAALAVREARRQDVGAAATWLAIGGLAKTWPLFVLPAFVRGDLRRGVRIVTLALLPVALTMTLLYLLDPVNVTAKVVRYRGSAGWWGTTGLLDLLGGTDRAGIVNILFYGGCALTALLWLKAADAAEGSLAILLAFLAFTPGFGPQYLLWIVPVALLVDRRRAIFYSAVAGVTVLAEAWLRPFNGVFGDYLRAVPGNLFADSYGGSRDRMLTVLLRLPAWSLCLLWWTGLVVPRFRQVVREWDPAHRGLRRDGLIRD